MIHISCASESRLELELEDPARHEFVLSAHCIFYYHLNGLCCYRRVSAIIRGREIWYCDGIDDVENDAVFNYQVFEEPSARITQHPQYMRLLPTAVLPFQRWII